MNKKEFSTIKDITDAKFKDFEKTYKGVRQIAIPIGDVDQDELNLDSDTKEAQFVICKPDRKVLNAVARYGADKNYGKANQVLVTNCVLGGDMEWLEEGRDDDIYMAVIDEIGKLVNTKKARLVKR